MFSALILTFCTKALCEEYVIDHKLTQEDCVERYVEESNDMNGASYTKLYKEAVARYKAVPMKGKIVSAGLKCVVDDI